MNSLFVAKKNVAAALCCCAAMVSTSLMANTYDASGETVLSNITETTRTVKTNGSGTLILSGTNELYGLQMSAGTLRINGGLTTVTGPGGTSGTTATFAQAGGTTIIEGGAKLAVTATSSYSSVNVGGDLMVTNGTYEIAGEFLNGFYVSSRGRLFVQDEGVFKCGALRISQTGTESLTDNVGLFLNEGGKIYVTSLYVDGTGRYGVIRYNGGTVYKTTSGDLYTGTAAAWETVKPYVQEGGFHFAYDENSGSVTMNIPLYSGTANDGGAHYSSSSGRWFYLGDNYKNSTFNGGTWIEGTACLIDSLSLSDAAFGTPPTSPTNNIFFSGSSTLFTGGKDYTINTNRNIWIDAGSTATIGCNSSGTGLRIGGTISVPDGENAANDTMFNAGNGTWGGFVVLDPGEGRTNRFDRINVARNLEIASGVTIVRSPSKGIEAGGPIYIAGNNSSYSNGYNGYGCLKVSGGQLVIDGNRYVTAHKWGQVLVNGGTISGMTDNAEYLNGLSSTPGTLTIENGGMVEFCLVRVAQGWDRGSVVNVNTGGVLRAASVRMDNRSIGTLNLNGGTIVTYVSPTMSKKDVDFYLSTFLGNDATNFWDRVEVRVLAGGAKFNTDGYEPTVCRPLISGVGEGETDGGLTKSGSGTLTMTKTSTYNGPTRLDGGTLKFADTNDESGRGGRPDTDIEFTAQALMDCDEHPFIEAPSLGMGAGKVIRVTECDTLDAETWQGSWHTVATFDNDIAALPNITFVKANGTVASAANGWNNWTFRISDNKKSLEFKRTHGTSVSVR